MSEPNDSASVSRRQLLIAGAALAGTAVLRRAEAKKPPPAPPPPAVLELMKLPYADSALAPGLSATIVGLHYGKHHKGYVDKVNELAKGTELAGKSAEDVVRAVMGKADKLPLFNAAAQAWNHDFYWKSMKPKGGGAPSGELGKRIATDFGSFEAFAKEWSTTAMGVFGSGWGWLVEDAGKLKIVKTSNADNPIVLGKKALLTIDVWEHAYYPDYQNRRADYVKAYLDSLANWDFASENLARK